MVIANLEHKCLEQVVRKEKGRTKITTKKHQKRSINATSQRTYLKYLLKKTFEPTKENPNSKENVILINKVINVLFIIVQSNEETCYCC